MSIKEIFERDENEGKLIDISHTSKVFLNMFDDYDKEKILSIALALLTYIDF